MLEDGRLKVLQIVLQECDVWPQGPCKYASNASCCAHALLSSQLDFQQQKGELQGTIEAVGYQVIFYPVYHCELNFNEYFWGRAKLYARAYGKYSFPALVHIVPEALVHVSEQLIFKYYQHVSRMMEAYRNHLAYGSENFKRHVFTRDSSHR
ncbi:hypothetical protein L873DRAFT_1841383 [Choiromyces venosus 120613-1]|uniref:Tc1-like transposase DDE domain-containing protein n=1 Tax=Choiromyces venosus 120613-1 TaxID=1336337 RepID=A0A3N4JXL5_9PEZI|nr:hypothetical protein L873DRAFT_1841383 [Choiromyces venosus 120613-1]